MHAPCRDSVRPIVHVLRHGNTHRSDEIDDGPRDVCLAMLEREKSAGVTREAEPTASLILRKTATSCVQ